jgi:hypothetical protein
MTYEPARPRYTLPLAGRDYELVGSFGLIEAVEHAMKENVVGILTKTVSMPISNFAELLATILTACGEKTTANDIGSIIWEMGPAANEVTVMRLHIHAFLLICVSPTAIREEVANRQGEMLGGWNADPASPGENTGASASASSAGARKRSGKRASGT